MLLVAITGCATGPPIETVESVNIERFMGDWYVIASIPTFIEKQAYNALESYRLAEDGTIETTFSFNKGGYDGPLKTYKPRGFIEDKESNAVWGMQFFWPFKAEYRIIYLTEDYSQTVIGRTKRDYVWIMARKPLMPEDDYNRILDFLKAQGYDLSKLRKVPHKQN
ncbi:MAG: lipocalin family protein [Desulfobacterales bacterium]|jgi:apolipoprotein D and lipocalin family protein